MLSIGERLRIMAERFRTAVRCRTLTTSLRRRGAAKPAWPSASSVADKEGRTMLLLGPATAPDHVARSARVRRVPAAEQRTRRLRKSKAIAGDDSNGSFGGASPSCRSSEYEGLQPHIRYVKFSPRPTAA